MNDRLEARLLNEFQRDFPLTIRPYAFIAGQLDSTEGEVIAALGRLRDAGRIGRIGAVFAPGRIGASTLAALAVPAGRLEHVAALVSRHAEVNHNYAREHAYNLWFVVTATDQARVDAVLGEIAAETGHDPLVLPLVEEFHIDLGFDLNGGAKQRMPSRRIDAANRLQLEPAESKLLAALESGLEIVPRPWARLAPRAGMTEHEALEVVERWLELGLAKRFGVIVRHRELGYTANARVVWDLPDESARIQGERLAREAGVTLCYLRPRRLPDWRYNLFCMVHGRERGEVERLVADMAGRLGLDSVPRALLFSTHCFKQCGARYAEALIDATDRSIVNSLQGGFPVCDEPYREVAARLGITESALLERIGRMLRTGVLTRFGPMFQAERMGGAFVLAALAAPEADFERIAALVNAHAEVAHNYRREHALNMWFVLATETPAGIAAALARIERDTGLKVYAFPKEREFFVGMRLAA